MRAILLAAGMGTRLRPLTLEKPKPLIKINGESMIERQIRFLQEKGIDDIIVVTGYLKEKFDFLADKYGVKLIHNDKYDKYNNVYTMYLVREYLSDSYVIEGDIYLNNNILTKYINESSYFSAEKYDFKDEWMLKFNEEDRVTDIVTGSEDGQYIMCGVSYWSEEDGKFISEKLTQVVESGGCKDLFWDNIVKDNLSNICVRINKIKSEDIYEIDSMDDLSKVTEILNK